MFFLHHDSAVEAVQVPVLRRGALDFSAAQHVKIWPKSIQPYKETQ
jgi:uncharacterized protein YigA (DUF484 family)